jgi:DNA polymerase IIIc chi subunit
MVQLQASRSEEKPEAAAVEEKACVVRVMIILSLRQKPSRKTEKQISVQEIVESKPKTKEEEERIRKELDSLEDQEYHITKRYVLPYSSRRDI